MSRYRLLIARAVAFGITFAAATAAAHATSSAADVGSSFDSPMQSLEGFLTGTPVRVISIIAIVVAGIALIFGEDLGVFAKRLLMVVIATAMIAGSVNIANTLFGGALVH
jgi:type IV secretory pathway VirB2 component (pilin)